MKQKARKIFQNGRSDHSGKSDELRYITLLTNAITTTIEKNLTKPNIKFVTTTSKTVRKVMNRKQNINKLKLESGTYSITCNGCHGIYRRNLEECF